MTTPELTPDGLVTVTEDERDWPGDGPHPDHYATVPAPVVLRLTPFQVREVEVGMDVDRDDGNPEWGSLEYIGKRRDRAAWLTVTNLDRALYRITSSRDIWQDNAAGGDPGYMSGARSLVGLTDKLIAAAGGRDAFSPEYRRWI